MTPAELRKLWDAAQTSKPYYSAQMGAGFNAECAILNRADALLRVAEAAERVAIIDDPFAEGGLGAELKLREALAALREVQP
ncbi:MAG: hypothetical protein RIR41_1193 [Pseudomonadota bacterium]